MNKPLLEIKNLKKYFYKSKSKPSINLLNSLISLIIKRKVNKEDVFYALTKVNFNLLPGEAIAIIGPNGAGKSTLLKIISRIYKASNGHIFSRGNIVSILELGIGFDKNLSVRENIISYCFMNNFKSFNITETVEKIAANSDLLNNLDFKLKLCPSGSFIKLAFSCMLFFDSEIIIADEILSILDANSYKFCINLLKNSLKNGKSALIVSHDLNIVKDICEKTIWLDKGKIKLFGKTEKVCLSYNSYYSSILNKENSLSSDYKCTSNTEELILSCCQNLFEVKSNNLTSKTTSLFLTLSKSIDYSDKELLLVCHEGKDNLVFQNLIDFDKNLLSKNENNKIEIKLPNFYFNEISYNFRVYFLSQQNEQYNLRTTSNLVDIDFYSISPKDSTWGDTKWTKTGPISPLIKWDISNY